MTGDPADDVVRASVRLGDSDWELWPEVVVRSAGFPAVAVDALADQELADAADQTEVDADRFAKVYGAAQDRLSAAIRGFAGEPRIREAVAWQNRALLGNCFDKALAGEPRNVRGRNHELTIASYVQRYHVKNDTIGFFGPVGWGRWRPDADRLTVVPGPELLAHRRTYFEVWAIDAIGDALAADPALRPWLPVRPVIANLLDGRTVHIPNRPPVLLSEAHAELLALCDGARCGHELAEEIIWSGYPELSTEQDVLAALDELRANDLVHIDLSIPVSAHPELALRELLTAVGDPAARASALSIVDALSAAKDAVAGAGGNAEAVAGAIDKVNELFQRESGKAAVRRPGLTYAGRTILYEDTVRDMRVDLGRPVLDAVAEPLVPLLDSAAWLVAEAADRYEQVFATLFDQACARQGRTEIELAALLSLATPYLFWSIRNVPGPVREPIAEMQRRWAELLGVAGLPAEVRRHEVRTAQIAARAGELFPRRPFSWSGAVRHAPDVMIAAEGPDAVNRGDFLAVLGELHLSSNTVESRMFVEQHDQPDRLRQLEHAAHGGRRVYVLPPKEWSVVTSRTYPPSALLSPDYTYWSLYPSTAGTVPGVVLPAAGMRVRRQGGRLVVSEPSTGLELPLLEVAGELLAAAVVNAFRVLPPAPHTPRVVLDKLVISRESWRFPAAEIGWAVIKNEARRYHQARAWREALGLPERAFYRVPVEDKPVYVDFRSLVLVNLFAKNVRRTLEHQEQSRSVEPAVVSVSEMLPDLTETWLVDRNGAGYTSELRLVAVNRRERLARASRAGGHSH